MAKARVRKHINHQSESNNLEKCRHTTSPEDNSSLILSDDIKKARWKLAVDTVCHSNFTYRHNQ